MYSSASRIKPWRGLSLHSQVWSTEGVAKVCKTHASSPRPFTFMHLQQPLADSRVNARSDNALDLGSLPRVRVLLVATTVVRRDAASMARSWGRLILHGWLRPREHILPRRWHSA